MFPPDTRPAACARPRGGGGASPPRLRRPMRAVRAPGVRHRRSTATPGPGGTRPTAATSAGTRPASARSSPSPSSRGLPLGHVAVVSRIVEKRVLMLTHANWSRQNGERGHAEQDVTLFDVSPDNDWSEVKVWYRDATGSAARSIRSTASSTRPASPPPELTGAQSRLCRRADRRLRPGAGAPAARR